MHEKGASYCYVAALAVHLADLPNFKLAAPLDETDSDDGFRTIEGYLVRNYKISFKTK